MTEIKGLFGAAKAAPLQNEPQLEFFRSLLGSGQALLASWWCAVYQKRLQRFCAEERKGELP
jgi:hypothetical protein